MQKIIKFSKREALRKMIELIVKCIVDYPDEVRVEQMGSMKRGIFRIVVSPFDREKVLGKNASTINAIQAVFRAIGRNKNVNPVELFLE